MIRNVTYTNKIDNINNTTRDTISKEENKDTDAAENGVFQDLGSDTFTRSTNDDSSNLTYKPVKNKLSPDEIKELKEDQDNNKKELLKKFISDTINHQNNLLANSDDSSLSKDSSDLLTKIFGSIENAYPKLATTPEEAQKAISDGGEYSVNAVANRIMTMATALAGNDKDKLQQMRNAVEEGFKQAGLDFSNATHSDLPQICKDTYTEVMKRFDKLQKNTSDETVTPVQNNTTTENN